jgi:cellulose synthase/poly-beta-1,6-N-acetylglucosamine synthase-like glycosyltransferase
VPVQSVWLVLYVVSTLGLAVYGLNSLYLTWRYSRVGLVRHAPQSARLPSVTVQLPLYNELNVVERLLAHSLALDYPTDRLVIQLLDDSSDGTPDLVAQQLQPLGLPEDVPTGRGRTAVYRRPDGLVVQHVRRGERTGYKAGALAAGMSLSRTDVYAVFDADFLPSPDFLARIVGHFADPSVGFVQTRWGHINRTDSLLTRLQALAIDAHFVIEQQSRFGSGLLFNFNGAGGAWRRVCIEQSGGWSADTLTEDLDLSYRAQLAGWRGVFETTVTVPGEVPVDMNALKGQQFRWAKGSVQTAVKMLPRVFRAPFPWRVKLEATVHLLGYLVHPLLLGLLVSTAFLIRDFPAELSWVVAGAAVAIGPPLLVITSQKRLYPDWMRRALLVPLLVMLGTGIAVVGARAVAEALLRVRSGFVRTPKQGEGAPRANYRAAIGLTPLAEAGVVALAGYTVIGAIEAGRPAAIPFLLVYAGGFSFVLGHSLASALRSRRAPSRGT